MHNLYYYNTIINNTLLEIMSDKFIFKGILFTVIIMN